MRRTHRVPEQLGDDPAGPSRQAPRITVLVPAHNEAGQIEATLAGLRAQTLPPDRIIVIADNCSDNTADLARAEGAEVYETQDNEHKKAGGLNQAWTVRFRRIEERRCGESRTTDRREKKRCRPARRRRRRPYARYRGPDRRRTNRRQVARRSAEERRSSSLRLDLAPNDRVLVMDADTVLAPRFLEAAAAALDSDARLGAAGGIFYGNPGSGVLGQLQRNEWQRYSRELARTNKVMVLSGTGTLFCAEALQRVAAARGTLLPGETGQLYDTAALTEDNELTLALKTLRYRLTSPPACTVTTEIMPSWHDLWKQRLRWQRGALENLRHYGLNRTTLPYWLQQVGIGLGVIALQLYFLTMVLLVAVGAPMRFSPFWTGVGGVFLVERLATVWKAGRAARLTALPLVLELFYDLFLQAVFVRSLLDLALRREATWHHLAEPAAPEGVI
jgi:cellulose synthase/poly-beta-1,6-N-acetylglucosamine synthase-like glycosyltransferase